ncbi:MAG: alpha/beta fold hydrolase [Planctomycetes bacterium]|nr:alpha/beta fold hydrolase [Planctomycetota bacterium]
MLVDLIQTTTRDGVRLDGMLQTPKSGSGSAWPVDGLCFVHGTGGNFYASTLFDTLAERCLECGCAVLRVNTRGHDGISNAVTTKGGRRLGAAYEQVDDCRHDLCGWIDLLKERVGSRVGLLGHSLGAVKCLYTLAHDSTLKVACAIAISPPRLSYAWFCGSPEGPRFLETYSRADALVQAGQPGAILEVDLPLPMAIAAAGYVEKYGPDERYNYINSLKAIRVPTLITLGELEATGNMAFRAAAEEIAAAKRPNVNVTTLPGADHFYSQARLALVNCIDGWLTEKHGEL